jgi:hypothetical protein
MPDQPRLTLRVAQERVSRQWPGRHATAAAWRAFHLHAAELYSHAAESDPAHAHEAAYAAQCERQAAQEIEVQSGSR